MGLPFPLSTIARQLRRHPVFYGMALACVLGYQGVKLYGEWGAGQLELNENSLPAKALPGSGNLRIGFFSDLHNDPDLFEECVAYFEKVRPDLIIFGGDFIIVSDRFMRTRWAVDGLRRLVAVAPCFAVLGNQDYEKLDQVERVYASSGVRLLRNEAVDWQTPGGEVLRIVGLGDWNEGDEEPGRCMKPAGQESLPVLLLSHDPESRSLLRAYDWDLMLSGHAHGGQLGNPLTGEYISFRTEMPSGLYEEQDGRHVFVTRGVGAIMGMRFFCPPEVNLLSIGSLPPHTDAAHHATPPVAEPPRGAEPSSQERR